MALIFYLYVMSLLESRYPFASSAVMQCLQHDVEILLIKVDANLSAYGAIKQT